MPDGVVPTTAGAGSCLVMFPLKPEREVPPVQPSKTRNQSTHGITYRANLVRERAAGKRFVTPWLADVNESTAFRGLELSAKAHPDPPIRALRQGRASG
jgi:hypothetical protein